MFFPASARGRLGCKRRGWCALLRASWAVIQPLWSCPKLLQRRLRAPRNRCRMSQPRRARSLRARLLRHEGSQYESCCSNGLTSAWRPPCTDWSLPLRLAEPPGVRPALRPDHLCYPSEERLVVRARVALPLPPRLHLSKHPEDVLAVAHDQPSITPH